MFFTPPLVWLIVGSLLCLMELIFPTAFVEFIMGLSAIVVGGIALVVPYVNLQVFLWMILSGVFIFLTRRFLPRSRVTILEDAKEAETLTDIPPGETGRVIYEGNSWRARCEDDQITIRAHQKVIVVRREGTTLIVIPETLLQSSD